MPAVRMDDPATWPGPVLAVVRPDGSLVPPLGLLVKGEGPCVAEIAPGEATPKGLRHCPRLRYPSWEALAGGIWNPGVLLCTREEISAARALVPA